MPTPDIQLQVTRYLERLHTQKLLALMSVDKAMIEVRQWIPMARQLSDSDLRSLVLGFFVSHSVYPPGTVAIYSPNSRAKEIIDSVKKAITLVIVGVPIYETLTGKVTISVKGLTMQSNGRSPFTSVNVSWTGTLSTVVTGGKFTLSNTLSKSGWSISLSYPKDTPVLDSTKVGEVFGAAGNAISSIIKETFGLTDVKDVRSVVDRFSPYMGTLANAIGVAQGIVTRPKQGLSVSVSVGSPSPGQGSMRGGIQGFVTLTYSW